MTRALPPPEGAGRFEDNLRAIVGGPDRAADRAASGLWRSVVASVGVGSAVILAGLGTARLTTSLEKNQPVSISIPVPQVVSSAGKEPPLSAPTAAPVRGLTRNLSRNAIVESTGSIVASPVPLAAQGAALVRHPLVKRQIVRGQNARLSVTGHQKLPFTGSKPLATRLARTTRDLGDIGTVNDSLAEQERSDHHVSPNKQAVIATRDALRDLRLR